MLMSQTYRFFSVEIENFCVSLKFYHKQKRKILILSCNFQEIRYILGIENKQGERFSVLE